MEKFSEDMTAHFMMVNSVCQNNSRGVYQDFCRFHDTKYFQNVELMCNGSGANVQGAHLLLCRPETEYPHRAILTSPTPSGVEDAISMYIIPTLCLLGMIFNVVTIGIICRKRLWNSTSLYLTSLGIVDLLGLISIFFMCRGMLHFLRINDTIAGFRVVNAFGQLIDIIIFTSNWLTVVLAVERYVAICHPVIAKIIYSKTRARIIVLGVCFLSCLIHLPQFFVYKLEESISTEIRNESGNLVIGKDSVHPELVKTVIGQSTIYINFHLWVVKLILFLILPAITLASVNVRLIVEVRRSTDFIRKHSGIFLSVSTQRTLSREQTKIATMLIGLIFVFFFFQLPIVIYTFLGVLLPEQQYIDQRIKTLKIATTLIYVIKSDVNFVFYCWLCDRFLCTVKNLVCVNCVYYLPFLRGKQSLRHPNANMSHTRSSRLSHNGSNSYIRCPAGRETTTV